MDNMVDKALELINRFLYWVTRPLHTIEWRIGLQLHTIEWWIGLQLSKLKKDRDDRTRR
jgi:hypothetical protein